MTERKHPEAECESCPLLENGRFCDGEGPEQADLVVVGEAPGRNEAREGRPFTGISGKVLDSVFQHYGINREEAYVTNAVLCRPSNNDTPDSKAVKCCSNRLKSDINNRGASTVLALGNIAAQSVMGIDDKITQLRVGPPKESHLYPGVTVIPSIHPAACLYSPDMFPHLVTDVGKLTQEQHKEFEPPEYQAFTNTDKAKKVLDELLQSSYEWVSFDLEVGVDKDADYSHPDTLLCAGLAYEDNKVIVIGEEPLTDTAVQQKLVDVLKSKKVLCHNGKFDLGVLYNLGLLKAKDLPGLLSYDTMLASYCVTPETRILKTDLTWTTAGVLQPGEEVVAFDEQFNNGTELKPATVTQTKHQTAPCYKIKTAEVDAYHGKVGTTEIICSANHIWPVKMYAQGQTVWRTTEQLYKSRGRKRLMHFVEPWDVDCSYEAGYVAGMLDGEGSLGSFKSPKQHTSNFKLSFAQAPGGVADRAVKYLGEKGFNVSVHEKQGANSYGIGRGMRGAIRAIGMFRPSRWIENAQQIWQGRRKFNPVDIVDIEYVGEREVVGIETTEGTYIAEGFLTHNCVDERPGTNGLKYLAKELLGAPDWDDEIKKYLSSKQDSFAMIPRSVLYKYNAYDAALTLQLKSLLEAKVEEEEVEPALNLLLEASMALLLVESEGVRIDYEHLDKLTDEFLAELDDLESKLKPWIANPRSPQQVKAALEEHFYRVVQTTDEAQLRELLKNADGDFEQFLNLLLEHRRSQKLYSTYTKGIRKRMQNGRVFPTFLLHGTTTGRLACRNPNLQNVPRESSIRQLFSCEPGNKIVQADYKAAELRVMACEAKDAFLKSVFREGRDLHSEVTKRFYGENFTKEQRVRGKAVVFGVSYGREAYSIAKEFEISVEEAQEFIDTFFELIPDVSYWREQIKYQVLKAGEPLQTHFSRKRRFWLITPENQQDILKEAYAFVPQSTASDLTLNSLINLHREVPVRITVHDSIIAEVPEEDAEEVGKHMCDVMQQTAANVYDDYVPFEAEYGVGDSWGDVE